VTHTLLLSNSGLRPCLWSCAGWLPGLGGCSGMGSICVAGVGLCPRMAGLQQTQTLQRGHSQLQPSGLGCDL